MSLRCQNIRNPCSNIDKILSLSKTLKSNLRRETGMRLVKLGRSVLLESYSVTEASTTIANGL